MQEQLSSPKQHRNADLRRSRSSRSKDANTAASTSLAYHQHPPSARPYIKAMPPSRLPPNESLSNPHGLASSSSLRHQTSQSRLGRTPTASSTRTRQQHDLFAPTLSRRPGGRSTPRIEDEVLADSESDHDPITQRQRPPQMRRLRNGSPEGKHLRAKGSRQHAVEEQDIVNRRPDGSYLLEGSGGASTMSTASTLFAQGQVADGAGMFREADGTVTMG